MGSFFLTIVFIFLNKTELWGLTVNWLENTVSWKPLCKSEEMWNVWESFCVWELHLKTRHPAKLPCLRLFSIGYLRFVCISASLCWISATVLIIYHFYHVLFELLMICLKGCNQVLVTSLQSRTSESDVTTWGLWHFPGPGPGTSSKVETRHNCTTTARKCHRLR